MLNAVLAIVLVGVAVAIVAYIARLVIAAAPISLGAGFARQRLQRYVARATAGDRSLERGLLDRALFSFQGAFYPYPVRTRALAQQIIQHHTGLLSRFIAAADHHHGQRVRLLSLAKADRLFDEHHALLRQYLAACDRNARARQRELEQALRANAAEVRTTLAALAAEIAVVREAERFH
jgi:hypothetical protein